METKSSARQTIDIIEQGYYILGGQTIKIADAIQKSVNKTVLYIPQSFAESKPIIEEELSQRNFDTHIIVRNCTAMEAAAELMDKGRIGCLNFASAKNPGGGFINGAKAQEESLSRASALYPTQMRYFKEMYEYNRSRSTYLYSDLMIYSPEVLFFKDDNEQLLDKPYYMDILTSPAVNIGAMINSNPGELENAENVMLERTDKVLHAFVEQGAENLILGAWGCGVFRNKPSDVARYFAQSLTGNGKYAKAFKHITFAVYDRSKNQENITAFQQVFD